MSLLADLQAKLEGLPQETLVEMHQQLGGHWMPSPGPQTDAYTSKAFLTLYGGEAGGGKALHLATPLPTPTGWTTMGEVQVGDWVIDNAGVPCRVVAKSAPSMRDTFCITFSDGAEIIAADTHQWLTSTLRERSRANFCTDEHRAARRAARAKRGKGKRPDLALRNSKTAVSQDLPLASIRTTREIYDTVSFNGRVNHSIDVAGPLELPEAELLIDPYVLGAWLGDGATNKAEITSEDQPILDAVAGQGYRVSHYCRLQYGIAGGFKKQLRQLGLLGNKHIPPAYLRASHDQRIALLQGLMDTDGTCDRRGQCEFTNTKSLAC